MRASVDKDLGAVLGAHPEALGGDRNLLGGRGRAAGARPAGAGKEERALIFEPPDGVHVKKCGIVVLY